MATVKIHKKGESFGITSPKVESDEIEAFHFNDTNLKQQDVIEISLRETFFSTAKRIPGIYWERCYCGMPANAPQTKVVLEETNVNEYRIRIYGHRWHCVKSTYDSLRQGRLFPKIRWDGNQVVSPNQDDEEQYQGTYPNIACCL